MCVTVPAMLHKHIIKAEHSKRYGRDQCLTLEFQNGWGISTVKDRSTYRGILELYEIVTLKEGAIHYNKRIAQGDVLGCLTLHQVFDIALNIATNFPNTDPTNILKQQTVPEVTIYNKEKFGYKQLNNVLVYNHFRNIDHSLFLLRKS